MNKLIRPILCSALMLAGLASMSFGYRSLDTANNLATDRNPLALQRSAYGRLLARLSESTVDRVWHLGVEQVVPHTHDDHDDHDDHGHDDHGHDDHGHDDHGHDDHGHDDHGHAHDAPVPANTASVDTAHDDHGHDDHGHDDHGHAHDAPAPENTASVDTAHDEHCDSAHCDHDDHGHDDHGHDDHGHGPELSTMDQLKEWYNGMRVVKYTRTNPYALSERHLATVSRELEGMLLRSYKMDPGHYGVYNSYHLFLTLHKYGGTDQKREYAKEVANATIAEILNENEDPEPWLTAASAATNLYQLEIETHMVKGTPVPIEILKEYRGKIGYCLNRFDELQAIAEENGTWANLSQERQYEIATRQRFARGIFEPFDVMIARAEERAAEPAKIEAEVADILDSIE